MNKTSIALCAALLLAPAGCRNQPQQQSTANPPATNPSMQTHVSDELPSISPEELGKLGAEMRRHPSEAERLLSDHGLNEGSFEKAIRHVSSDPEQSKRYAAAYKKARS